MAALAATDLETTLRFACDCCHAQKLRCPRTNDGSPNDPCTRCHRARVSCIVSPPGKVGRPAKGDKRKASSTSTSQTAVRRRSLAQSRSDVLKATGAGDRETTLVTGSSQENGFANAKSLDEHDSSAVDQESNIAELLSMAGDTYDNIAFDPHSDLCVENSNSMMPVNPFTDPLLSCSIASESDDISSAGPTWSMDFSDGGASPSDLGKSLCALLKTNSNNLPTFNFAPDLHHHDNNGGGMSLDNETGLNSGDIEMSLDNHDAFSEVDGVTPPPGRLGNLAHIMEEAQPIRNKPNVFSTIKCYQRLSVLSIRIVQSLEKWTCAPAKRRAAVKDSGLLNDIAEFCKELITIATQSMLYFQSKPTTATPTQGASLPSQDASKGGNILSQLNGVSRHKSATANLKRNYTTQPAAQSSVPESSIIFLLLASYTQILQALETALHHLSEEYLDTENLDISKETYPETIKTLLEVSLATHTITHLLNRIQHAFRAGSTHPDLADKRNLSAASASSKKATLGKGIINDELLRNSFDEINNREHCIIRAAQELQKIINSQI